jgi:hypothetical protein
MSMTFEVVWRLHPLTEQPDFDVSPCITSEEQFIFVVRVHSGDEGIKLVGAIEKTEKATVGEMGGPGSNEAVCRSRQDGSGLSVVEEAIVED